MGLGVSPTPFSELSRYERTSVKKTVHTTVVSKVNVGKGKGPDMNFSDYVVNDTAVSHDPSVLVFVQILDNVGLPLVLFVGLVGNCLSIAVFAAEELRTSSTSVYILANLVSDSVFLLTLTAAYLEDHGVSLLHEQGICFVIVCLASVTAFTSVWFMVCLSLENYIAVCHPRLMTTLCTTRRAVLVTSLVTLFPLLLYSLLFFFSMNAQCFHSRNLLWAWPVLTLAESCLSLVLPSAILVVCFYQIVRTLLRQRYALLPKGQSPSSNSLHRKANRPHARVAVMLVVLSGISIGMRLPSYVVRSQLSFQLVTGTLTAETPTQHIVGAIFLYMYQCSFATKFFVFISLGKNFRKVLWDKLQYVISCYRRLESH